MKPRSTRGRVSARPRLTSTACPKCGALMREAGKTLDQVKSDLYCPECSHIVPGH